MRNGNLYKSCVSEICVKQICVKQFCVNQGVGVLSFRSAFLGSKSVIMLRYSIAVCQDVKAFCFTAPWFLNWRLIFRTHNLFINHENILFKICKVKTYCFLRLNVHSWISLEYLPWNCRYHLLKEVVCSLSLLSLYSIFTNFT